MCLTNILQSADWHSQFIRQLRNLAPIYPIIYTLRHGLEIYSTTMVMFEYNGVAYLRHHVDSIIITPSASELNLLEKIKHNAELTKKYAIPYKSDEVLDIITLFYFGYC